jgi:hypothetical protein
LGGSVALSSVSFAQIATSYEFGFFTNAHRAGVPDAQLSVINPGSTGGTSPGGDLCANIYVFNTSQEILECCSCKVTPDGLRTFSVNTNLTDNTLSAATPVNGVIKIVSSQTPASGSCGVHANVAASTYTPLGTVGAWITHPYETGPSSFSISDSPFFTANLTSGIVIGTPEVTRLQVLCAFIVGNGSGFGICGCGTE